MASLLERVLAAHRFDSGRFVPFEAGARIGWIRRDLVARLRRWPEVFTIGEERVRLSDSLADERSRTAALAEVARGLARDGVLSGWRDETFAISGGLGAPLFHVERSAVRFFGLTSSASHLNGFVQGRDGIHIWIARRSAAKSIDPALLDTLVGGGIPSGQDAWEALLRECGEEAGIERSLAIQARPCGMLKVCHEVPNGLHSEVLHTHDLELSAGFRPHNVDGEVSDFMLLSAAETADRIANGQFTVEAGLVALDFLMRHEAIGADARLRAALDRCRVRP